MANSKLTGNRGLIGGGFQPIVRRIRVGATPDGTEQASGLTLPANAVVLGAWLVVKVAEATGTIKTIDLGTPTDPNGYLAAADVSALGVVGSPLGALFPGDETGDVASGGENVVFTAGDVDWVEFRGDIYVMYLNLSDK